MADEEATNQTGEEEVVAAATYDPAPAAKTRPGSTKLMSSGNPCPREPVATNEDDDTSSTVSEALPPYTERPLHPRAVMVSSATRRMAVLPTFQVAMAKSRSSTEKVKGRALADSGGQTSLVTQRIVNKLGLRTRPSEVTLTYAEGKRSEEPLRETTLEISSPVHVDKRMAIKAYVVPQIAEELQGFRGNPLEKYPSANRCQRPMADEYTEDGIVRVDLLIGADYYWRLGLMPPFKPSEAREGQIMFQDSHYGLIVSGAVQETAANSRRAANLHMFINKTSLKIPESRPLPKKKDKVELDEYLRRMVELDTVGIVMPKETQYSAREEKAMNYLEENLVFLPELKRYQVKIPFDETKGPLVNNMHMAKQRFQSLMSQLERDDKKREMYVAKMNKYFSSNHASLVTAEDEKAKDIYYLPHSGVLEPTPDGKGWKLRVVFDGSAKDRNGLSPNTWMIQGPVPDVTILRTLVRWRAKHYAVSMDIKDCFLMILVHPDQQNLFRFLWMEPGEEKPRVYKFTSLIFGSATSPWISSTCLYKVLEELQEAHPQLVRQVRQNLYVDDLLLSFDTVEEGMNAIRVLEEAFESKSFGLAKFKANDDALLAEVADEQLLLPRNSEEDQVCKALGVAWRRRVDHLSIADDYQENFRKPVKAETKRTLARKVASIYDPLNLVAPWRIGGQVLLSQVWDYHGQEAERLGIAKNSKKLWDLPLPEQFQRRIAEWAKDYQKATDIAVMRCYSLNLPIKGQWLCGFSDASVLAFGAMVYMVTEYKSGAYTSTLICARMKVNLAQTEESKKAKDEATKKKRGQTIPRAELLGAKFLAVLVHNIKNYLDIEPGVSDLKCLYFTDSTTALCYMRSEPERWKVFVANAVKEIRSTSKVTDWYHVPGIDNPADMLTRPHSMNEFLERKEFWIYGPEFIRGGTMPVQPDTSRETEEMKAEARMAALHTNPVVMANAVKLESHFIRKLDERYGEIGAVMKYAAILMRFARWTWNTHRGEDTKEIKMYKGSVLMRPEEYRDVMDLIASVMQKEDFGAELNLIKRGQELPPSSRLAKLDPVLEKGLLRVRARLDTSQRLDHLPSEWKRPIIIPNKNDLAKKIILHVHWMTRHAGASLVRSRLRKRWWILSDQRTIREVVESCYHCRVYLAKTLRQKMGPLPATRLAMLEPCFTHIAIDAMGPLKVFNSFQRPTLTKKQLKERRKAAEQGVAYTDQPTCKVWVLVIGCMTTRCINLVILDRLDTESFSNAMRRHSAEHGLPKTVRLDNFKSHISMSEEVDALLATSFGFDLQERNRQRGIKWSWSAPLAPSTNGVIERLVRTAKEPCARPFTVRRSITANYSQC